MQKNVLQVKSNQKKQLCIYVIIVMVNGGFHTGRCTAQVEFQEDAHEHDLAMEDLVHQNNKKATHR